MTKRGFTLAEVLITLGIIGVIAALTVPAMNKARPDANKVAYLKAYDTIVGTIKELTSNSLLYPVCKDSGTDDNVNCADFPLFNTNQPIPSEYHKAIYRGERKLCSLMAFAMGVSEANNSCNATVYAFNAADYTNNFSNQSFTTQNGMRWRIVPRIASTVSDSMQATFQNDIYVDVNGQAGPNCIYSDSCKQPDIFKFMVTADGTVTPADPMGKEYIKTRKDSKIRDYEIENNEIIALADNQNFTLSRCEKTQEELCIAAGKIWDGGVCKEAGTGTGDEDSLIPSKITLNLVYDVYYYKDWSDGGSGHDLTITADQPLVEAFSYVYSDRNVLSTSAPSCHKVKSGSVDVCSNVCSIAAGETSCRLVAYDGYSYGSGKPNIQISYFRQKVEAQGYECKITERSNIDVGVGGYAALKGKMNEL